MGGYGARFAVIVPRTGVAWPGEAEGASMSNDMLIFAFVCGLRLFVPLLIPRFPLPAIIACLIIDGVDQTVFQKFTDLNLDGYQSYDKALDIYYLAIAYLSTFRNWDNIFAFDVSRFLYYFRLIGVVLFEASHLRALLLFFPNTFEYFFIFYEAVRTRWNPVRMGSTLVVIAASVIWFGIKIPQEYWIHIAQLDVTDTLHENPDLIPILAVLIVALIVLAWWIVVKRCPPADHRFSLVVDDPFGDATYRALQTKIRTRSVFDLALAEKVILVGLICGIFSQILPGLRMSVGQLVIAVSVLIVLNTLVSEWLARRGYGWESMVVEFFVVAGINLGIVFVYRLIVHGEATVIPAGATIFYLFLISILVTLYDRYQPYLEIREGLRDGTIKPEEVREAASAS